MRGGGSNIRGMATPKNLKHLAGIRLFAACNPRDLQRIAKATDELDLEAGRVLMEQGQRGMEAFVIVEGRAGVDINGVRVAEVGPGQAVGELALLDGGTRTATVTALTDMVVLVVTQQAFSSLLDEVPGLARRILVNLAGIVRDFDAQMSVPN